jgi:aspartate racemase
MRKIGLLGGMSWESTALYYELINREVRDRLGGLHSARCVLASVDFHEIEHLQSTGDWETAGIRLAEEARSLEAAGAQCLVLCTNTMHKVADSIAEAIDIPLIHLADVTAAAVREAGLHQVALLGTRFTMEETFYRGRLAWGYVDAEVPGEADRATVDRVIYDELVLGEVRGDSRTALVRIIDGMVEEGCEGVVLGCTELELLVRPDDVTVPVFPTTALHATAAVDFALQ